MDLRHAIDGQFCWVDLAATDIRAATTFYRELFGWQPSERAANAGTFTRLRLADRDVASMYPLRRAQVDAGATSHWTPYVRVADADDAAQRVQSLGGRVLVQPFAVTGVARIALVQDGVGAQLGLWQSDG